MTPGSSEVWRPAAVTQDLITAQARALKMPGLGRVCASLARQAREEHWTHVDYLHEVLTAELQSRHESVIRQRLREARFPEDKTLEAFDFHAAEGKRRVLFTRAADLVRLLLDERRSTIVTTNLAFAEWVTVFAGDEKLTTALLDRLAHHATVITTKGKSYRMRKRRTEDTRGA